MRFWRYGLLGGATALLGFYLFTIIPSCYPSAQSEVAASSLTKEEQKIRKQLEEELKSSAPTHRVWPTPDRFIEGVLESETDTSLILKQSFGKGNFVSVPYKKSDIVRIEMLPPIEITPADIHLKMEFSTLTFFKRPPYSAVTDESYFLVRRAMDALETLHRGFRAYFSDWVGQSAPSLPIQIVFFGNQDAFRRYTQQHAPHLTSASGYYSTDKNRLILFNQTGSEDLQEFRNKVADLRRQWTRAYPQGIPAEVETQLRLLESRGIEYTYTVIRHEGAHQLLRSYGILTARPSILWLEEGLAAFCETPSIGQLNSHRIQDLRRMIAANRLIAWRDLVEYQSDKGFLAREAKWSEAAYAQSWLMVYSLLSYHKEGLLKTLRPLRDGSDAKASSKASTPPFTIDRLLQALGLTWSQLESEWQTLLKELTRE